MIILNEDDRIVRRIIENLMCGLEADLEEFARKRPPALLAASLQRLAPLVAEGVVERQGLRIKVPRQQAAALRLVAAAFDDYLPQQKALHSVSV